MSSEINVEPSLSSGISSTTTTHRHSHKGNSTDDPLQEGDHQSTHRKQKSHKNKLKNSQKKQKPPYKPAYLDVIQLEIDKLKQEARRAYEIQARQNATDDPIELTEEEQDVLNNRSINSPLIDKLEDLKSKVSSQDMIRRVAYDYSCLDSHHSVKLTEHFSIHEQLVTRFQQETITLLHFFYIVRLAQKGFFNFISQSYPDVDPNALIHLCDKLVGGSLFVIKDPVKEVRLSKKEQVFDLLHKLHDGVPEKIGDGYPTTFQQVQHLIRDFIGSAMSLSQPIQPQKDQTDAHDNETTSHHSSVLPLPSSSSDLESVQQQPPIWLVVPFHGMVDEVQQPAIDSSVDSGRKNKVKKTNDKKKPSKTVIDEHADDTSSVISFASRNTESTEQANRPVSHELDQSGKAEQDDTKTAIKDHTKSIATTRVEQPADAPSIKDTLTDGSPLDNKDHSLETVINTPATESALNETNDNADAKKETILDTTNINGDNTGKEEEEPSGWGTPSINTTASPAWTQNLLKEDDQQQLNITGTKKSTIEEKSAVEEKELSGWGSASTVSEKASSAWTQGLVKQQPQQEQAISTGTDASDIKDENTIEEEATSTGWGDTPITTSVSSESWKQGQVEQLPQPQTDLSQGNGWGSPVAKDATPSPWEGKLPDDLAAPGDETINGDLADSSWQAVEFDNHRQSGRGRSSSYRGGGYRSFNDGGRGMRRGGTNTTGWGNRPNRP